MMVVKQYNENFNGQKGEDTVQGYAECLQLTDHGITMAPYFFMAKQDARIATGQIRTLSAYLNNCMATGDLAKTKIEWENKVSYLELMLEQAKDNVSVLTTTEGKMKTLVPKVESMAERLVQPDISIHGE